MSAQDQETPYFYTKAPFWENKKWYSLWILQLITILPFTGFFGLDHLFLRSPLTAFTKLIVNICTLGLWYFYDILQVTIDKEVVQTSGLSIPLYGAAGIGAGMFTEAGAKKPDEGAISPWRFMAYCLLTLLPFGLDFFVTGDYVGGGLRFMTSAIFVLWPLGFLWGCFNMYRAWINPADVLNRGTFRIWPFNMFVDTYFPVKGTLAPGSPESQPPVCREKGFVETLMEPVNTAVGVVTSTVIEPVHDALENIAAIPLAVSVPLKAAVEQGLAPTVTAGVKVAHITPKAIAAVPQIVSNVQGQIAAKTAAAVAASNPANLLAKAGNGILKGGTKSNTLEFSDGAVLFTLGLLIFGGVIITFIRSKNNLSNDQPKENDTPPNPRIVQRTSIIS